MRLSPWLGVAVALGTAALVAAACGPGTIWTGPSDSGDGDGDADGDADTDADTDADSDRDADPDVEPADAGDGAVMGQLADVTDTANEELCNCFYAESGYSSAAACATDAATSALVRDCLVQAYLVDGAAVAAYYACRLDVERAHTECIRDAGCVRETVNGCGLTRVDALAGCPAVSDAVADAFYTELARCSTGPPSGCPDQTPVSGTIRFASTTEGLGDDTEGSCGGSQGADISYRWTAPRAGTYVFDTVGSEYDTVLYVVTGCAGGTELGCNDDIDTEAGNRASRVTVELASGQIVVIVVDGWGLGDFGDYVLNITFP